MNKEIAAGIFQLTAIPITMFVFFGVIGPFLISAPNFLYCIAGIISIPICLTISIWALIRGLTNITKGMENEW